MPNRSDLITLAEAIATYGHTSNWWYEQARAGHLTMYALPGDRNTYLSRSEVARYLNTPQPKHLKDAGASTT
jgi:hypothetical protein